MKKKKQNKPRHSRLKQNDEVFFTAFLKKEKTVFYICRGIVQVVPEPDKRQVYKVQIVAVGDRPIGGSPVVKQGTLLGRTITKHGKELTKEPSPFMCPPSWIEMDPKERLNLATKDKDGVINEPVRGGTEERRTTKERCNKKLLPGKGKRDGTPKRKGQETQAKVRAG